MCAVTVPKPFSRPEHIDDMLDDVPDRLNGRSVTLRLHSAPDSLHYTVAKQLFREVVDERGGKFRFAQPTSDQRHQKVLLWVTTLGRYAERRNMFVTDWLDVTPGG